MISFKKKSIIFIKSLFSTAGQKFHISCSFERDQLILVFVVNLGFLTILLRCLLYKISFFL
jgi:hypothetical protein